MDTVVIFQIQKIIPSKIIYSSCHLYVKTKKNKKNYFMI